MEETIKNLLRMLPGYRGYEAQESRREADQALRIHLTQQYRHEQQALTRLSQRMIVAARLKDAEQIAHINQVLDRFVARLETAPYGYAGWFEHGTIDEHELDQLYLFDAKLADSVPLLREQVTYVESQINVGGEFEEALASLRRFADDLHAYLDARQALLASGKQPTQ